jgi:hypothetical protein
MYDPLSPFLFVISGHTNDSSARPTVSTLSDGRLIFHGFSGKDKKTVYINKKTQSEAFRQYVILIYKEIRMFIHLNTLGNFIQKMKDVFEL